MMEDFNFQTIPRPKRKSVKPPRHPTRFEVWAWSPIVSFQVGLTASYVALAYFGFSSLLATPPTLELTTPEGYAGYWSIALLVGAIVAAIGSVSRAKFFERLETGGSSIISLTVGSYTAITLWLAYMEGDVGRISGGAGLVALSVPLIIRTLWLYSRLLRK